MKFFGIIPARYASTRFPGKPLADILGKPMIQHVVENVSRSALLSEVTVATDDQRIADVVFSFGAKALMTSDQHKTGTDRVYEAALQMIEGTAHEEVVVINIQGDEPFIDPGLIDSVCRLFEREEVEIATAYTSFSDENDLFSPNSIKLTSSKQGKALYFSRSVIPFNRNEKPENWFGYYPYQKHIGIYAYRFSVLEKITRLEQSPLELSESLEQLRWLENGFSIYAVKHDYAAHSVDVPEDILRLPGVVK